MSQGNGRIGYVASDKVRLAADALIATLLEEVHPEHHYVVVPSAMFEVFMGFLRTGAGPNNGEASEMVGRGAVCMLEGVSATSGTSLLTNVCYFAEAFNRWLSHASVMPSVEEIPKHGPRKEAS